MHDLIGRPDSRPSRARLAGALLAACALAWLPAPAAAAPPAGTPDVYGAGPIRLQDGEKILIGLLLPAVQKVRANAQLVLTDAQGKTIFSAVPDTGKPTYYDITFHAKPVGGANGASIEVAHGSAPPVVISVDPAGILIGLLLPAVQKSGATVAPMSASMQAFNANGATMAFSPLVGYAGAVASD